MKPFLLVSVFAALQFQLMPHCNAESWFPVSTGSWLPSKVEVSNVKATLQQHMQALAKKEGITMPPWDTFTLQFAGDEQAGRRRIVVRGSCTFPEGRDPRREWIVVIDGGPCYFIAEYDVVSKSYVHALFDGSA